MSGITRRDFVQAAVWTSALSYSRILGANERIRLGYIGLGNRGDQVHQGFLGHSDCQTVAVCDLREDYMDFAVKRSRSNPTKYKDYKKLLESKDVDAVVVATPDHWHALMFVDACNAGKDVYVEKPLSRTVREGRKMVEVAQRTNRVSQVGINWHSFPTYKDAAELVRAGGIGHVTVAKCSHLTNEWPNGLGNVADGPPPDEWEWDQWLGPAPKVPYNRNRMYYNFRWFYDYSPGQVANFGVHDIDTIRWCLGLEAPKSVVAMGGKFAGIKDNREVPDTLVVVWEYPGSTMVVFEQCDGNDALNQPDTREMNTLELRGTKGTMYLHNGSWDVVPQNVSALCLGYDGGKGYGNPLNRAGGGLRSAAAKRLIEPKTVRGNYHDEGTTEHARNFLDCIKSRAKCNCDILTGHVTTTTTLIGEIAHRTKSYLEWDAPAECFTNNVNANKFLEYHYRAPYKLA
jgi:predicted dehydrogenase